MTVCSFYGNTDSHEEMLLSLAQYLLPEVSLICQHACMGGLALRHEHCCYLLFVMVVEHNLVLSMPSIVIWGSGPVVSYKDNKV